jgi:hypothetical protein
MIFGLVARLRSLWRGLRRRSDVEAEMSEEFRLHVELRAADLVRSGLSPAEAQRQARLEFGHMESHKEEGRASRGLKPLAAVTPLRPHRSLVSIANKCAHHREHRDHVVAFINLDEFLHQSRAPGHDAERHRGPLPPFIRVVKSAT